MKRKVYGHLFFKEIKVEIIVGKKVLKHTYRADPGRMFGENEVDKTIENVAKYCEEKMPRIEFRMVELLPNFFKFIAVSERVFKPLVLKEEDHEAVEGSPDERNSEGGVPEEERPPYSDVSPVLAADVEPDHDDAGGIADASSSDSGSEQLDHRGTEGADDLRAVRSDA